MYGLNGFPFPFLRGNHNLKFDLRLHLHIHFHAADDFFITPLDTASHYLIYRKTVYIDLIQRLFHIFKFVFSYICLNFYHHIFITTLLIQSIETWICALAMLRNVQAYLFFL